MVVSGISYFTFKKTHEIIKTINMTHHFHDNRNAARDDYTHWPKQIIFSKLGHQFTRCSFVYILSMRGWVKPGKGDGEGTHRWWGGYS